MVAMETPGFAQPVALDSPVRRRSSATSTNSHSLYQVASDGSRKDSSSGGGFVPSLSIFRPRLTRVKRTDVDRAKEEQDMLSRIETLLFEGKGLQDLFSSSEGEKRACEGVVKAMTSSGASRQSDVQEAGCWAIIQLAVHDGVNAQLGAAGACEATLKALRLHNDDKDVTLHALGAIAFMADEPGNREILRGAGACGRLVDTLAAFADADVQFWACRAVWELAVDEISALELGEVGACDAVVNTLRNYCDDADGAEWGLGALAALQVVRENAQVILGLGGLPTVLQTMRSFSQDAGVQQQGCKAIRGLALAQLQFGTILNGDADSVDDVFVGGCELVVHAMHSHAGDSALQGEGSMALYALACGPDSRRQAMQNAGALEVLKLAKRSADAEVSQCANRAIVSLLGDDML